MPKEPTKYFTMALPENMYNALKQRADEQGAPVAGIVRAAVEMWFKSQGIKVEDNVLWGGYRDPGDKDNAG